MFALMMNNLIDTITIIIIIIIIIIITYMCY